MRRFSAVTRAPTVADLAPALTGALLDQSEVGLAIWDRDLRYVSVNPVLAAINGVAVEQHRGVAVGELGGLFGADLAPLLREVIGRARPAVGLELTAVGAAERHWRASYYPLRGDDGAVVGVGAIVSEITDRKLAEAELAKRERGARVVARAREALGGDGDPRSKLRAVGRLVVPELADWFVADVAERDGSIRRWALTHADPAKESLGWELTRRYPSGAGALHFTPRAIRSSLPELVPDIPDSLLRRIALDERHLALLRALGLRSLLVVPLVAHERNLGALALVCADSGRRLDRHDVAVAEDLAQRCAALVG